METFSHFDVEAEMNLIQTAPIRIAKIAKTANSTQSIENLAKIAELATEVLNGDGISRTELKLISDQKIAERLKIIDAAQNRISCQYKPGTLSQLSDAEAEAWRRSDEILETALMNSTEQIFQSKLLNWEIERSQLVRKLDGL